MIKQLKNASCKAHRVAFRRHTILDLSKNMTALIILFTAIITRLIENCSATAINYSKLRIRKIIY